MAKLTNGVFEIPGGFTIQNPNPLDDRLSVSLLTDLISDTELPNPYPGMVVSVAGENYDLYRWNGLDRTQSANWILVGSGEGGTSGSSGTSGTSGTSGSDGVDGTSGTSGVDGLPGDSGTSGTSGTSGFGIPIGGTSGQALIKLSPTDYDTTWGTIIGGTGAGTTNYLLRLEYDVTNHLVNNTTQNTFITATGFETSGANVDGVTVDTGTFIYTVTLSFANESNPPFNILVYAWDPVTYKYQVHPYRVDSSNLLINTASGNFTAVSNQYTPDIFGTFSGTNITIDVRQDYMKYGNKTGLGTSARFAHAYMVFAFG